MTRSPIVGVGAVAFHNLDLREAVRAVEARLADPDPASRSLTVVTPNALIAEHCERDDAFCRAVNGAGLRLADGYGVLLAAKLSGRPLKARVAGVELGEELLASAARSHHSVYFLGGRPGVALEAAARMREKYPTLRIVGSCDGYFSSDEEEAVTARIVAAAPDMLFVCLGSPRQELFLDAHRDALSGVKVALALGGTIDILAGRLTRAPRLFADHGLEWLWRMARQPHRLAGLPHLARYLLLAVRRPRAGAAKP